ncbi:MAG: ComEC/Rec2 family competence protein [Longilinea sp.]|nr:ComEC/Rec2 family competence protein [Longilinea sp.]
MPLLWLSLAFLAGLGAAAALGAGLWLWAGLSLAALALSILEARFRPPWRWLAYWRRFGRVLAGLVLLAFCLGGLRYVLHQPAWQPRDLAYYNDSGSLRLVGVISAPPDLRDASVLVRVRVERLTSDSAPDKPVRGVAQVFLLPGDWRYGDRLELIGEPQTPGENDEFSYRDYLAGQGIHSVLYQPRVRLLARNAGNPLLSAIYSLRASAHARINQLYPQPEAALLSGILLGLESDIPADVQAAFRVTGTAHIIAISGFNISILSGLFLMLFSRLLPRPWAALAAVLTITAYTILVGADPPVTRAAIMGAVGLGGLLLGRRQVGVNSLAFTAALMSLFNPLLPWNPSFQLSFTATLGMILYAGPFQSAFTNWAERRLGERWARRLAAPVGEYLLTTLAAQLTTLPVIWAQFRQISLVSLIANPLILPPQPLVMTLGGVSVIAALIFLPLGRLLAAITLPLLSYTIHLAEWLAGAPLAAIPLSDAPWFFAALFYAALLFLTFGRSQTRLRRWLKPATQIVLAALLAGLLWRGALSAPDGRLHLTALGLEGGRAVLIQTPGGASILVDAGPKTTLLSDALGRRLPLFDRSLDAVILTDRSAAALAGLPRTLERYPAAQIYWNAQSRATARRVETSLRALAVPTAPLLPGQAWDLGDGARLTVLADSPTGTALLVEYGAFRALLPGNFAPADLPNAGSFTAIYCFSDAQCAAVWQGRASLIFGESTPLSAAAHGWSHLTTDGTNVWISTQR